MKRFRRVSRATTVLAMASLLAMALALLPGADSSAQAPVQWKFYIYNPAPHPFAKAMMQFADEVKTRSGGRLDIKVFPAGELPYRVNQAASIVGNRLVEMSDGSGTFLEGEIPIASLVELPYLMETLDQHRKAVEAFLPSMTAAAARYDAEVLFWYGYPVKRLNGRGTAPKALEDLKGKKIRTLGSLPAGVLSTLGMTPVTTPPGEVPIALERGIVQGTTSAWFYVVTSKWHEQLNWSYNMNLGTTTSFVLVNRAALRALPPDVQAIMRDVGNKYGQSMLEQSYKFEQDSGETMRKTGIVFVTPTAADSQTMKTKLTAFGDQWTKRLGKDAEDALAKMRAAMR